MACPAHEIFQIKLPKCVFSHCDTFALTCQSHNCTIILDFFATTFSGDTSSLYV